MASRIRRKVEPLLGWLFLSVTIAALALVLYVATTPRGDVDVAERPPHGKASKPAVRH
jgi:choline-glycine betaine transporter